MDYAQAFSPGHVTGLFSIHEDEDPLRNGSLGAGFCLALGVTTKAAYDPGREDHFFINGDAFSEAPVSKAVIRLFYRKIGEKRTRFFTVRHDTILPVGCGFGTSGAGALSLSLALNALHGDPLSFLEAASVAHLAELECKTGLGTVIGETFGGFEIRQSPGAPGTGRVQNFFYPKDLRAVFLVFGSLSTSSMLKNAALREKINRAGGMLRQELQKNPSFDQFLKLSRDFSLQTGLMSPQLRGIQESLGHTGFVCPMLMFGEGLYTLVPESDLNRAVNAFQALQGRGNVFTTALDPEGGRVLDVH